MVGEERRTVVSKVQVQHIIMVEGCFHHPPEGRVALEGGVLPGMLPSFSFSPPLSQKSPARMNGKLFPQLLFPTVSREDLPFFSLQATPRKLSLNQKQVKDNPHKVFVAAQSLLCQSFQKAASSRFLGTLPQINIVHFFPMRDISSHFHTGAEPHASSGQPRQSHGSSITCCFSNAL